MILLKEFLKKEKIDFSFSKKELEKNSEDTSLFKIMPSTIVFPKNKFEISKVLIFINKNKDHSVISRSGGTDMSGGAIGKSIIFSFTKYFYNIERINKEKKEAIVEPGVYYRDLEKETLKQNLLLPTFPASREICAIGGMIMNNSGGEKSLVYGKTKDYIQSLECILSNGEIVIFQALTEKDLELKLENLNKNTLESRIYLDILKLLTNEENRKIINRNRPIVSKNSSGYYLWDIWREEGGQRVFDLSRLICGSQGSLAILSKAKLRLVRPEKYSNMMLIFLKDLKDLGKVREVVMKYHPESFESYDDHTFRVALKFWPALLRNIFIKSKDKGHKINYLKLAFSFWKELKLLLFFGMPKLFLIAEFGGQNAEDLKKNILACQKELKDNLSRRQAQTEYIATDFEREKYWTMRRESFNLLRQKVKGLHTAPFIDDIIVRGKDLSEFLQELIPILDKYKLFYTIAGHVGDGNVHIIPLMNFDDKEVRGKNIEIIKNCSREVYTLVKKYRGSITAEHNDGLIRTPFLDDMYDVEMLNLFKEVKNIFDPNNILNPGKKVPIDKDLSVEFENNLKYLKF